MSSAPSDSPIANPTVATPDFNPSAGIQVALTVLALAALPITAWLYISTYVDTRVEQGIKRHDVVLQTTLSRQSDDIDRLQSYVRQLCREARRENSEFLCEVRRYNYQYGPYSK